MKLLAPSADRVEPSSARRLWCRSAGLALAGPSLASLAGCAGFKVPGSPDAGAPGPLGARVQGPGTAATPSGAAGQPAGSGLVEPVLAPFSQGPRAIGPGRWEPWGRHPTKPPTRYDIIREDAKPVLQARATSSVSGLKHRVNRPAQEFSQIRWRWRIDSILKGADVGDRHAEDAPARLLLAFDGDRSQLSMRDLMLAEQFQLFTGQVMPYATLMYVWDSTRNEGEVVHNPHSGRIRKVVVQSGGNQVGRWVSYQRDFQSDFLKAFGESPGRLIGVGVMTDSDNTRQSVRCLYGDVELLPRKAS